MIKHKKTMKDTKVHAYALEIERKKERFKRSMKENENIFTLWTVLETLPYHQMTNHASPSAPRA